MKLSTRAALVVFPAAAVALACATRPSSPVAQAPGAKGPAVATPSTAPAAYPVIVRLVGRDKEVTISAGPDGPVYSASTKDGRVLVTHAKLDELRVKHPDVYRFVHPAIVTHASDSIDASYRPEPLIMADHAGR
jgi:hypothetical protein